MPRVEAAEWTGMRAKPVHAEFEAFFCEHREMALRVAQAITGDRESASDAAQEAFVRILDRWKKVSNMQSPEAFLKTTIVRCAIDILRSRARLTSQQDIQVEGENAERIAVQQALSKLSPDHQAILALSIGEGWSYDEIAASLKIPQGTVASRIHAAKEAFRRVWGDER